MWDEYGRQIYDWLSNTLGPWLTSHDADISAIFIPHYSPSSFFA